MLFFSFLCAHLATASEDPPEPIPSLGTLLRLPPMLSAELAYVSEPMFGLASSRLNYAHGFEFAAQLSTGFAHEDPSSWTELDHWILTFDAQQYYSTGDLAADMGVVNPAQEIFNPDGIYLGELSLTRNPGADPWYVKLGSLSMDADFLSPAITSFYTHAAFNNQYNVAVEVFPISPINAMGAVLGYEMPNNLMLKTGVYQLSSVRADFENKGWTFDVDTSSGLIEFVQLEGPIGEYEERIDVCPPDDHTFSHRSRCKQTDDVVNELPEGSWQVGAFFSQDEEANDRAPNHGVYGNLTVPINIDVGVSNRFWLSGMYGFHPERNPVPFWAGAGWITQGLFETRHLDMVMLGFSWTQLSLEEFSSRELLFEVEYGVVLTNTIMLQPNVQWYIESPDAIESNQVVMGLGIHAGI